MSLLEKIKSNKNLKDTFLSEADISKNQEFINTGSIILNLAFSGKINGGVPKGRISMVAAPSASGKSFIASKLIKNAQKQGMAVILIDTEWAFSKSMADSMGIDYNEMLVIQDNQIESVQSSLVNIMEPLNKDERANVLVILDSFGGLVTSKTFQDAIDEKDVKDMTIAPKKNSFSKLMMGLGCTVFVVNHVYDCLTPESLVQTKDGIKQIKDVQIGDMIVTTDGLQPVEDKFVYEDAVIIDIELEDGTTISCTEGHKFIIEDENFPGQYRWVEAGKLFPGLEIATNDIGKTAEEIYL